MILFHIIIIMWLFYSAPQKPELLQQFSMLCAAFHGINAGGFYVGVPQNIGKSHNILLQRIKGSCKKVSEIMGENLIAAHPGGFAQAFEHFPYMRPVKRFPGFCNEDGAAFYISFFYI